MECGQLCSMAISERCQHQRIWCTIELADTDGAYWIPCIDLPLSGHRSVPVWWSSAVKRPQLACGQALVIWDLTFLSDGDRPRLAGLHLLRGGLKMDSLELIHLPWCCSDWLTIQDGWSSPLCFKKNLLKSCMHCVLMAAGHLLGLPAKVLLMNWSTFISGCLTCGHLLGGWTSLDAMAPPWRSELIGINHSSTHCASLSDQSQRPVLIKQMPDHCPFQPLPLPSFRSSSNHWSPIRYSIWRPVGSTALNSVEFCL